MYGKIGLLPMASSHHLFEPRSAKREEGMQNEVSACPGLVGGHLEEAKSHNPQCNGDGVAETITQEVPAWKDPDGQNLPG
jgi:hypothetical protein